MTLINLSIALFRVFDAALDQGLQANLLWEIRRNIAILLTAGAVSIYYWLVLQEDRKAVGTPLAAPQPEVATAPSPVLTQAQPPKSVTVLVSEADLPLVQRLEARLGYNVQTWRWVEGPSAALEISEERLLEVARRIIEAGPDHVLLLRTDHGLQVCPYQILEPTQETI